MPVRILVADDHEVIRQGVRAVLLASRPAWQICGEAANGKEAIQAARELKPDVVLLDITMPVMSGLDAASDIAHLGCRVLIFTMHESEWLGEEVRRAGAHGYVQKSQANRDLIRAIESVLAGGTFFDGETEPKTKENPRPKPGIVLRGAFAFG